MSRKQPANPNPGQPWPPEVVKQSALPERTMKIGDKETKIRVETRTYKLLTPLFGGGVEASTNDPDCPIRASEIRGQLRFWWRATRGGLPEFQGQLKAMKDCEDEIWGAASNTRTQKDENKRETDDKTKSAWHEPVQIEVEIDQIGKDIKPFKPEKGEKPGTYKSIPMNGIPDYAAFPLRPDNKKLQSMGLNTPVTDVRKDITFTLKLTYPPTWTDDVQAALWAWETFGGVGGRTRRGFGVLMRTDEKADLPEARKEDAEKWLQKNLKKWCAQGTFPEHVPHLGVDMSNISLAGPPTSPLQAWKNAIFKLKSFRQAPHGRDKRSNWPEAETIRQRTGYRYYDRKTHKKLRTLGHPQKFPRAAFGLPIVFHFKNADENQPKDRNFDPLEMTLQGAEEGKERWASPLILRPLVCQKNQALSMACVLLGSTLPEKLQLVAKSGVIAPIDVSSRETSLASNETDWLPVLHGETNILKAFLAFF